MIDLSKYTVRQLKELIENYNLHFHIRQYSKKSREELEVIVKDFMDFVDNKIVNRKNPAITPPKQVIRKKREAKKKPQEVEAPKKQVEKEPKKPEKDDSSDDDSLGNIMDDVDKIMNDYNFKKGIEKQETKNKDKSKSDVLKPVNLSNEQLEQLKRLLM
jgi:hypothetical protein